MVVPVSAASRVEPVAEVALDGGGIGARQPAAGPLEPGLLGILVEDLAGVDLADEDARRRRRPGAACRRSSSSSRPSRATSSAAAAITLGSCGGSHDLVDRRTLAANDGLPGGRAPAGDRQHVAERLGEQDRIAADGRRESAGRAGGRRPRGPRAGRAPSTGPSRPAAPRRRGGPGPPRPRRRCPPFMSEAPLPVSRPSSTRGGTNGRWTVSRWPSNWSVGPGRPLSNRIETAGAVGMPRLGPLARRTRRPRGSPPGGRSPPRHRRSGSAPRSVAGPSRPAGSRFTCGFRRSRIAGVVFMKRNDNRQTLTTP